MTIAKLAKIAGVTTRSIERNLQKLQEEGRLRRVGADKGGYWEVCRLG
jgi:predicted HTH transcriptional regulator